MKNKIIIGISGFIGSGKTTAGEYFRSLGADFINSDWIVRDLYKKDGAGAGKISSFLGEEFLTKTGSVDRGKLAKFVFNNIKKLTILNSLIHPLVFTETRNLISKSRVRIIFVEAVYFKNNHLGGIIDGLLFVGSSKSNIIRRAVKGGKYDRCLLEKILKIQKRPKNVDWTVRNDSDIASLKVRLQKVWHKINKLRD